jgi:hypothetical protein
VKLVRVVVLVAGVSLAAAPGAPAALSKAGRPCASPGSHTVARSAYARVFTKSRGNDHRLVGCLLRNGKRRLLHTWYNCSCSTGDEPDPDVGLAGRYAAVNNWSCPPPGAPGTCVGRLRVIDLRSGRVRHAADTGAPLSALLVKPNGSVAFLLGERLIRIDSTGTATLDEGPGIDPASLAASSNRLYWMRGGAPQTAPFA